MVPMLDPMVPGTTMLFAITPALVGVALALLAAVAVAIRGTARELRRHDDARSVATSSAAHAVRPRWAA